MTRTLEVFMKGLIDYAGLFPPARLDMSLAAATYARHLDSEFGWMLGCFICPVGRLDEFAKTRAVLEEYAPIQVSVLGTPPSSEDELGDLAKLDAEMVSRFAEGGWAKPVQFEVKWPGNLISTEALQRYDSELSRGGCDYERLFFEIDRRDTWMDDVRRMTGALAAAGDRFGFKIRTGGPTPDFYPDPAEVAAAITACTDAGVPFKATAGLHHPIRHERSDEGVTEHGFFNVFGGAALLYGNELNRDQLLDVLDDRDSADFRFESDRFVWRDHSVGIDALRSARSRLAFSYGSCSFDEPLHDLAVAELL